MTESISLAVHPFIRPSISILCFKAIENGFLKGQGSCLLVGFIWGGKEKIKKKISQCRMRFVFQLIESCAGR